jgi:DNA-binding MarR family transcriptional regulator
MSSNTGRGESPEAELAKSGSAGSGSAGSESRPIAFARRVKALEHALDVRLAQLFRPLALTCVQADVLMALLDTGPTSLAGLAQQVIAESGHPSRLVSRMVDRGLLDTQPAPDDRRAIVISLTDEGRELAEQARALQGDLIASTFKGIENDLDESIAVMGGVEDRLKHVPVSD